MIVDIENLEVTYLGKDKPALVVDSLKIKEGESVLITGKSGSGKSTLVSVINGVIPHLIRAEVKGKIRVYNVDTLTTTLPEISKYVGTLLQDPDSQAFNYYVIDEVAFGLENYNIDRGEMWERIKESMKTTGTSHLMDREVSTLSGGELQRIMLASILAMRPKLIILDEPTSNIDPQGTREILETIKGLRERGMSLIIVEHKIERVLQFVNRILVLDNGRILFDLNKDELVSKADTLYELGLEIPEYLVFQNKKDGISTTDYLKNHNPPLRKLGGKESLYARIKVSVEGNYIVNAEITLKEGTITALMGRSGSGKTTLLKGIMGLLDKRRVKIEEEKVRVYNEDLSGKDLIFRGAYIAYLPQFFDVMFVKRSVEDEIAFTMKNRKAFDKEKLESILDLFSLKEVRNHDPLSLSMGQRRRVAIASVLVGGAKVILLDEPTSGQDWFHRVMLGKELQLLRDKQYTILVVTHDSHFVDKFCDYLFIMDKGNIVLKGKPEEVFPLATKYGIEPYWTVKE